MKKIISFVIVITMLMSIIPCAFAAQTEEYQKVLLIVKERLDIKDEYDNFDSSTQSYNGQTTYNFNWSTEGDEGVYLSVGTTADGIITEYYYNDNSKTYNSDRSFKKYELEQYKEAALNFIGKLNPSLKDNIIISETDRYSLWSERTTFSIEFVHNGIPVENIQGSIAVDSEDLSLLSFSLYDYADVAYPDKSAFIDRETAVAAYNSLYGLELVYNLNYEDDKIIAKPAYQPITSGNEYINAVTGEKYKHDYSIAYANLKYEAAADMTSGGGGQNSFSRIEQQEIENVEGLLEIKELEEKLKAISILNIPNDASVLSYYLNKTENQDKYTYSITLGKQDESCYITVDAKSGDIKNFRNYSKNNSKKSLPKDTLKANAEKYAKELAGNMYGYYKDNIEFEDNSLTMHRTKNGARVEGDTIRVTVNENDGKLNYYNISYTEAEFPALDAIVTKDTAAKALFDSITYDVKYIFEPVANQLPSNAVAVYSFDYSQNLQIDPFTAKLINDGNTKLVIEYNDIEGHYAENQIKKLAQYNIGFDAQEFKPDSAITQKNLITLLTQAFSSVSTYRDDYNYIFERAEGLDLISKEERDDNAVVPRLQAAVFTTRALGAEKYAQLDGIWSCPFGDVSEKTGYVCLLKGMGIINGDENGNFNPADALTNADAAIIIHNALSK